MGTGTGVPWLGLRDVCASIGIGTAQCPPEMEFQVEPRLDGDLKVNLGSSNDLVQVRVVVFTVSALSALFHL